MASSVLVKAYPNGQVQASCVRVCPAVDKALPVPSDVRLPESLKRTKRRLMDLGICNDWDYFVTFTFAADRFDYSKCKAALTKFFNNYKQRVSDAFKYVVVPEQHRDGAFHFHGFLSGVTDMKTPAYVDKRLLDGTVQPVPNTLEYLRWDSYKLGHFSASRVRNNEAAARYIVKYVGKGLEDMQAFPKHAQLLLCSQGLNGPRVLAKYTFVMDISRSAFKNPSFETPYIVVCDYSENDCELTALLAELEYCRSIEVDERQRIWGVIMDAGFYRQFQKVCWDFPDRKDVQGNEQIFS